MTYKVQARGENGAVAVIVEDEAQALEKAQELRETSLCDVSVEPPPSTAAAAPPAPRVPTEEA